MLALAAAAIVAWWVWPPSEEVRGLDVAEQPAVATREQLPSYVLETDGGLAQPASDTESGPTNPEKPRHRYRRDTAFEWVLRPEGAVEFEIGVRGFAFVDGGSAGLPLSLDGVADVDETGTVRIAGKITSLGLEPGRYTIALAVGRPAELPREVADVSDPGAGADWSIRRVDIAIVD